MAIKEILLGIFFLALAILWVAYLLYELIQFPKLIEAKIILKAMEKDFITMEMKQIENYRFNRRIVSEYMGLSMYEQFNLFNKFKPSNNSDYLKNEMYSNLFAFVIRAKRVRLASISILLMLTVGLLSFVE